VRRARGAPAFESGNDVLRDALLDIVTGMGLGSSWGNYAMRKRRTRGTCDMKIKVLGPGCARCKELYAQAEKAVASLGMPTEIEKVDKIDEIKTYGAMATPALVVDGEVKCAGRIPTTREIVSWIATAAAKEE
jgi:small redox-active disulfide protein 2